MFHLSEGANGRTTLSSRTPWKSLLGSCELSQVDKRDLKLLKPCTELSCVCLKTLKERKFNYFLPEAENVQTPQFIKEHAEDCYNEAAQQYY